MKVFEVEFTEEVFRDWMEELKNAGLDAFARCEVVTYLERSSGVRFPAEWRI